MSFVRRVLSLVNTDPRFGKKKKTKTWCHFHGTLPSAGLADSSCRFVPVTFCLWYFMQQIKVYTFATINRSFPLTTELQYSFQQYPRKTTTHSSNKNVVPARTTTNTYPYAPSCIPSYPTRALTEYIQTGTGTGGQGDDVPAKAEAGNSSSSSNECSKDGECRKTNWTPDFGRRLSWSAEEKKHKAHVATIHGVETGPGFTEQT